MLWSVKWSKREKCKSFAKRYLNMCHNLKVSAVVFDGYDPSTKDGTRRSRYCVGFKVIDVALEKLCPSYTNDFLANVANKNSLI